MGRLHGYYMLNKSCFLEWSCFYGFCYNLDTSYLYA